jgi:ribosomal protein S18 acetylase RimI-like enzyme
MLQIEPGQPQDAEDAARLIADTDRELFTFCGGNDIRVWIELSEWEWREERGIYSYHMSHVARQDGAIVGLLIGYSSRQHEKIDWTFGSSGAHMPADRWARVNASYRIATFLFPAIPSDAYYVQNIVTDSSVRRSHLRLGSRLMELAFEQGRAEGCKSCHLDVSGTNPAVGFYEHLGFRVLVKTEVCELPNLGVHYRMACEL